MTDDPRRSLAHAQAWVGELLTGVGPDQLDLPTPCDQFTVRELIGHILAVQERIRLFAVNGAISDDDPFVMALLKDLSGTYAAMIQASSTAWDQWTAEELDTRTGTAPFGTVPGRVVLLIYTSENLVHGWDLAVATGQPSEADPDLVGPVLADMKKALPAEPRGGDIPFAPVVDPAPSAGLTEQLANWTGRTS